MVSPHAAARRRARAIGATLPVGLALAWLFALRFLGEYNHWTLANVLLLGLGWAVVSRGGHFAVLAHLRQGTLRVGVGERVRKGDPLALVGNSGASSMPHLHLQVQTHPDLRDPDNRSVPFGFEPDGRVLRRNDRVGAPARPDPRASREGRGRSSRVPRPPGGRGPAEAASRSGRHERGEHR